MTYEFRGFYIPEYMMGGIRRYIDHGIPPGSFLTAIIENNLREAVSRADDENMRNLPAFVAYFYNEAPASCWGSRTNLQQWMKSRQKAQEDTLVHEPGCPNLPDHCTCPR